MSDFLPVTKKELRAMGCEQPDFVYVCGDAYVDHPSFGMAIITRVLQAHGYSIGIIAQPNMKNEHCMEVFGKPRLSFLVSSGNMDSMVNHYYVSKKPRENDLYSPGGRRGFRPDYAVIEYCKRIRESYGDVAVIVGGIEGSLRRMAHYDYWSNSFKRSVLLDSGADIVMYGMGEKSIPEIADALASGLNIRDITFINGTVYKTNDTYLIEDGEILPSYEDMKRDKTLYIKSFMKQKENNDPIRGKKLVEPYGDCFVVQNPPAMPLSEVEMDDVYNLPYTYTYHPMYESMGGIPAIEEVKFSIVSNRGCFGSCNFCALAFHQGRIIQTRSHESIVSEAKRMTEDKDFKGYIHDVGGPTANFRHPSCKKQLTCGTCANRECLVPSPCKNMDTSHTDYVALLRKLRKIPKVKKVFIRSGIRFDYLMADENREFFNELIKYHISGQLKVAPEHVSNNVLEKMGKPEHSVYVAFKEEYERLNKKNNMDQYLVPYYMSSHPGSSLKDAIELALFIKETGVMPRQVQDFYPTPSTLSTVMYYTELDPYTFKHIHVAKNPHEKAMQRALMQYKVPENRMLVEEALTKAGRTDLIGYGPECLIRPASDMHNKGNKAKNAVNVAKNNTDGNKKTVFRNNGNISDNRSRSKKGTGKNFSKKRK